MESATPSPRRHRFYSVAEAAEILRMDKMTVYRAIRANEFPAIKVRGRYVVPARALDAMEQAAVSTGTTIDAAEWSESQGAA